MSMVECVGRNAPARGGMAQASTVDVSIHVATVNRFDLADKAFRSILNQRNATGVTFELVVVDNSEEGLSRERVAELAKTSKVPVRYVHEPQRNISRARNAGFAASDSRFAAYLDDDCFADGAWLDEMLAAMERHDADVLTGPVHRVFEGGTPPAWDPTASRYGSGFELPSGTPIRNGRGGHLFVRRATALTDPQPFDPAFGRIGGCDYEFMTRLSKRGLKVLWCATATVDEFMPKDRMTMRFQLDRTLRYGQLHVMVKMRHSHHKGLTCLLSMAGGALQMARGLLPWLVAQVSGRPKNLEAYFRFHHGLGKLTWPRARDFY